MTRPDGNSRLAYVMAACWLAVTVSLASWWLSLGLYSLPQRLHRMFIWEGIAFISLLLAGGVAILVAIRREHRRRQSLETFFLSFTHDLKTSLASVELQAEGLREDWPEGAAPHVARPAASRHGPPPDSARELVVRRPTGRPAPVGTGTRRHRDCQAG